MSRSKTSPAHTLSSIRVKLGRNARPELVALLTALLVVALLLSVLSACAPRVASSTSSSSSLTGTVDILTPTGSNKFDSNTPLNTWTDMSDALYGSLRTQGFADTQITRSSASTLSSQIDQISRLITTYSGQTDRHSHVLLLAPVRAVDTDESRAIVQRYGDLVTQPDMTEDSVEYKNMSTSDQNQYTELTEKLASTLSKAQKMGMTVVLMAQKVPGFTENYYVSFSTAQSIARIQTDNLVKKLQLDKATTRDRVAIEMILPMNTGSEFTRTLFSTAWKILQPYFTTGVAYSPSGLLNEDTTDEDWRDVTIARDNAESVTAALESRLIGKTSDGNASDMLESLQSPSGTSSGTFLNVNGILAFNDFSAQSVVSALSSIGFTGTSASVNPNITLESIVKTLTDNADVRKARVPAPADSAFSANSSSSSHSSSHSAATSTSSALSWPVVTGYGAAIHTIPDIVNGKIWITTMEDRNASARAASALVKAICKGETTTTQLAKSVPDLTDTTITVSLVAVNADNLKKNLLDTGYISAADAGL
ncbi:hypothetical protein [Alloscardovia macacae]|uniref:Periplasmic binding protein domain-containing protein n=1 Tax=Alloscardovia macacae TaxID=1160091 RepID=A0A261F5H6_9BIFI|nr:hypothetical protein [Alloscardovia macacae]OZG54372.1 hypothetical protein ALMA_0833 [Alloscardovia macacae]